MEWDMSTPPLHILVRFDADTGTHDLYAHDGCMAPMPAGPRIFRAPPLPDIKFSHELRADAEKDAATLRKYLAALPERKPKKPQATNAWD